MTDQSISRRFRRHFFPGLSLFLIGLAFFFNLPIEAQSGIEIQRTPENGLQPRLLQDQSGTVHLLYFRKRSSNPRAREGHLVYRQFDAQSRDWGPAVYVTQTPFNHADPIYRANFAVDDQGIVHVVWHQSRPTKFFYSHSDRGRTAFEPPRSMVSEYLEGVDAGADIAVNGSQVAIVWAAGALIREHERTVYARLSHDGGTTFSPEIEIGDKALGACACCSLALEYSTSDNLLVAYRSAIDGVGRHMQKLHLDPAKPQTGNNTYDELHPLQQWELAACPVSTNDFTEDYLSQDWLVFETEGRIIQLNTTDGSNPEPVAEPTTRTRQKNPDIAFSSDNYKLVVWAEGLSFTRGGSLNWQLFDNNGEPVEAEEKPDFTIPDNSSPAAVVTPAGSFLILY